MASKHWKLELDREVPAGEIASEVGAFLVLRTDSREGKTTVYFAGDEKDVSSAKFRGRKPTAVDAKALTKLS